MANTVSQKQHPTSKLTSSVKQSNPLPIVVDHVVGGMVEVDKKRGDANEEHKRRGGSPPQNEDGH